jgi:hypothetical protein
MNGRIEPHPMVGNWRPGGGEQWGYAHPMWGAAMAGISAVTAAENESAIIAAQQNAQIAMTTAMAQSAPMTAPGVKMAIASHLTAAQQILADPAPTLQTTSAAGVHVNAANILLSST